MCSFGFIPPLTYSGSKKDSFYNLIKPSVAPVAPVGDCSSSQTRCLLFHFHVMPARQMTNTGTNLSLWNTIQTPSLLFSFSWITSVTWKSRCLYESLVIWVLRHDRMREEVPREMKVRGGFSERKCREVPVLQTADYLYMARGPLKSRGSPLWGAHGEYVTGNLTMTSGHFVSLLLWGGKTWTCLVITGVLMLAMLSEDAALCHYCAPALIIDSIKMAVKLDVPISSGACCLF